MSINQVMISPEYETAVSLYVATIQAQLEIAREARNKHLEMMRNAAEETNKKSIQTTKPLKEIENYQSKNEHVSQESRDNEQDKRSKSVKKEPKQDEDEEDEDGEECIREFHVSSKGKIFTSAGPAEYTGNILENPELLWSEDQWNKERELKALESIEKQGKPVSDYWKNHYINKAGSYWNGFYKRNQDHFYKDRHYIHIVFPELQPNLNDPSSKTLLEVGCGVGNAAIPLLDVNPKLSITAIDFAQSAITILQNHIANKLPSTHSHRIQAFHHDITQSTFPFLSNPIPSPSFNYILCMFVLSAIPSFHHLAIFQRFSQLLFPGGKLFLRDYGKFDEAQLRFKKGSKLEENFYVRQDGTCSYFFTIEELTRIAEEVGLEVEEMYYIYRQYANRQQKKARYRVWIHAKLLKK